SRLAAGLRAQGARPGDRIGVLSANSELVLEAYYAISWAGCVFVPFNTRWASSEIEHALDESRPHLMFIAASCMQHREIFAGAGVPVIAMDDPSGALHLEQLVRSFDPMNDEAGRGNDLAGIFYTGGTTGRSKGVMISHANLVTNFFLAQAVQPYARSEEHTSELQ